MNRRRPTPFDIGPVHFVGIGGIEQKIAAHDQARQSRAAEA